MNQLDSDPYQSPDLITEPSTTACTSKAPAIRKLAARHLLVTTGEQEVSVGFALPFQRFRFQEDQARGLLLAGCFQVSRFNNSRTVLAVYSYLGRIDQTMSLIDYRLMFRHRPTTRADGAKQDGPDIVNPINKGVSDLPGICISVRILSLTQD
jgi:hypothetical protein